MGSGSREYQYTIRFAISEKQQEEGISQEYNVYNFGEYTVLIGDRLVLLYKQNVLLSTYNKDQIMKIDKDYIKIKTKEPGILLKISKEGI